MKVVENLTEQTTLLKVMCKETVEARNENRDDHREQRKLLYKIAAALGTLFTILTGAVVVL